MQVADESLVGRRTTHTRADTPRGCCRFRWSREAARRPVAGVGDDVGNDDRAAERVRGTGGWIEGRWNSDFSGDERLGLFGIVHGPLAIRPSDFAERDYHAGAKVLGRSRTVAP
jgi:hypothetical protein